MTQDEIRKLLGGYATDALTPDERRLLFQAALEDQELFNTLANEDALKELLNDPMTRAQVRAAIRPRRRGFHPRRWLLGVAIPAVVAVALVVLMDRAGAPRLVATNKATNEAPRAVSAPAVPVPAPAPASPVAPPRPHAAKRGVRAARSKPDTPENPRQNAVAMAQLRPAPAAALANLRAARIAPIPASIEQQFASGFAFNAPLYQGPLVRYALLRSGPNGRAVRVQVTTEIAGYLALYEVDVAGKATRVYPASEVAARVAPNVPIHIPAEPLEIREAGAKLRLVVTKAPMPGVGGAFVPRTQGAIGGAVAGDVQVTPLVVEIPLAP
jgi:hypothetical protein